MQSALRLLLASVVIALLGAPAQAVVFDWDQSYGTWTAGAPSPGQTRTQNYNNDPSRAGNDISISITNSASNPNTGPTSNRFAWVSGSPKVDDNYTGGTSPAQDALQFQVAQNNPGGITVTINFNYTGGVRDVSFSIWDIDRSAGQFTDQIFNITAVTTTGAVIGATSVTGSASNVVAGSGTGITITGTSTAGDNTAGGRATINFGSTAITQISFTWRNTDPGQGQQFIALHDITYTPIPEVGSSIAALALCGGFLGFYRGRGRATKAA